MIGKLVEPFLEKHGVKTILAFEGIVSRLDLVHLQREAVSVGLDLEVGERDFLVRNFMAVVTGGA